jgi:hypothetical protein
VGKEYARAFVTWQITFGFPQDKGYKQLYEAANLLRRASDRCRSLSRSAAAGKAP